AKREADARMPFNGGRLAARALQRLGVRNLFTLSGGHLFPLYDGCVELGIRLLDTRDEASAVYAAEGWGRLTREPGLAAVTAGPGVTNALTGIGSCFHNKSSAVVIGGRAPDLRWGQGSLQEMDHLPVVRSLTRYAATAHDPARVHLDLLDAWAAAAGATPGPSFLDVPMDVFFTPVDESSVEWPAEDPRRGAIDEDAVTRATALIAAAEKPVVLAGSGVYWHHGEAALVRLAEAAGLPVFVNGMGRGTIPSDHPNAFSRTRGFAVAASDLVILLGTPLDFRLNFGSSIGDDAKVIRVDYEADDVTRNRVPEVGISGNIGAVLEALAESASGARGHQAWLDELRAREQRAIEKEQSEFSADNNPIHPMRIYGEVLKFIDRDAIVIGDGGDFVSYAGKVMPSFLPGHWLDPGPFGALGMGPGYAMAARLAHPDKQVLLMLGDGAAGFSIMEFDTMVRHHLPVVAVVGNNAAWGLEKHPMEALYGYSVAADLNPGARYDQVVAALGGHGELVTEPAEIGPAIRRAFNSGIPALVNIVCDPAIAYPRQTLTT
ncbi:MAG: acetolactate synthase, partial [Candidatus Dormibacteria bacterium]